MEDDLSPVPIVRNRNERNKSKFFQIVVHGYELRDLATKNAKITKKVRDTRFAGWGVVLNA
jgi:hypothetical protein